MPDIKLSSNRSTERSDSARGSESPKKMQGTAKQHQLRFRPFSDTETSSNLDHNPLKKARYETAIGYQESQAEVMAGQPYDSDWEQRVKNVDDEFEIYWLKKPEPSQVEASSQYAQQYQAEASHEREIPRGEKRRIKVIIGTFSRGSWIKKTIYKHLKTNNINTYEKVKFALECLNDIESKFSNHNQYDFTKNALLRIQDEIRS